MTKKIGALWLKTMSNDTKYFSGVIQDLRGDINIAVFKNDRKEKPNQPDYNIVLSERQEQKTVGAPQAPLEVPPTQQGPDTAKQGLGGTATPPAQQGTITPKEDINVDQIPF